MNILISSLGVGTKKDAGYQKANYEYNGRKIESEFISKALTEFLNIDKLFLIGTTGSIWDSAYEQFGGKEDDTNLDLYNKIKEKTLKSEDLDVVNSQIDENLGTEGSKCFLIDYGINETELWNNFSKYIEILDYINEGDTVYLDITHSFRSLSLMSFVMLEFGNLVKDKKFKVAGIFYGMLDIIRENNGIAPIVDLKILYDLMQWIKAINSFKKYGNAYGISELLKERDIGKEVRKTFNNFSDIFLIGNMAALQNFIKNSESKIKMLKNTDNPIIKLLSKDIFDFFERFKEKSKSLSCFQLELSRWHFENKNYGLSYYALIEAFISFECEIENLNPVLYESRENIKFGISRSKRIPQKIKDIYFTSKEIRNNSAHYLNNRENSYKNDINNLENYINKIQIYFKGVKKL